MKAYAVLGSDDHFVGIWRDRETAEKVMARSAWAKGERIVEMVEHTEALMASTADKEHLLHAINALCDERDALKVELANIRSITPAMVAAARAVFGEHVEDTDSDYRRILSAALAAKERS